jgi:hypothetical protein
MVGSGNCRSHRQWPCIKSRELLAKSWACTFNALLSWIKLNLHEILTPNVYFFCTNSPNVFLAQTEVVLRFRKGGGKTLYKGRSMFLVYEEKTFWEKNPYYWIDILNHLGPLQAWLHRVPKHAEECLMCDVDHLNIRHAYSLKKSSVPHLSNISNDV